MMSHGGLNMTEGENYFARAPWKTSLAPLGNKAVIKSYIDKVIDRAEWDQGGQLPRIYYVPVADSSIPLALPTHGIGAEAALTFELAAGQGTEYLTRVISGFESLGTEARRIEEREEAIRQEIAEEFPLHSEEALEEMVHDRIEQEERAAGREEPSSAQMRSMLRQFYEEEGVPAGEIEGRIDDDMQAMRSEGKVEDSASMTSTHGELPIDRAADALDAIAGICNFVGTLTSSTIVGIVFVVLAVVCEIISAILRYVRGYRIPSATGYNAEWDSTDGTLILRDRLDILVQCDAEAVEVGNLDAWNTAWTKAMEGRSGDERWQMLRQMVVATAWGEGDRRIANAQAICQMMGGSGDSYKMCEDIRDWLLFVGVKRADAEAIYTWLYEARKVTAVLERRRRILADGREGVAYTGSRLWWRDKHNIDDDDPDCLGTPSPNCRCGSEEGAHDSQPNFYRGTNNDFGDPPGWYEACRNLPKSKFRPFSVGDLHNIYMHVQRRLEIVPMALSSGQAIGGSSWAAIPIEHYQGIRADWPNEVHIFDMPSRTWSPVKDQTASYSLRIRASRGLTRNDVGMFGTYGFYTIRVGDTVYGVLATLIKRPEAPVSRLYTPSPDLGIDLMRRDTWIEANLIGLPWQEGSPVNVFSSQAFKRELQSHLASTESSRSVRRSALVGGFLAAAVVGGVVLLRR
jgi:hypothetical protein